MSSNPAPERIHHVSMSQFSIARHFGGIRFNGHEYRYNAESDTLVRLDVLKADNADKKAAAKAERERWLALQGSFDV